MGGPFDIEPGPAFAGDEVPEPEEGREPELTAAPREADPLLEVDEETVRSLLLAQGSLVHGLVALDKAGDEWVWLAAELDAITPPLTRIINRYDPLRQLALVGDPLAVAIALGGYGRRSLETRTATKAAIVADAEAGGDVSFRFGASE